MRGRMALAFALIILGAIASQQVSRVLSAQVVEKATIAEALDDAKSSGGALAQSFLQLSLAEGKTRAWIVRGEMRRASQLLAESRSRIAEAAEADAFSAETSRIIEHPTLDLMTSLELLEDLAGRLNEPDAPFGEAAERAVAVGLDLTRRILPILERMKQTERAAAQEAARALSFGGRLALFASLSVAAATWFLIFAPLKRRVMNAQDELQEKRRAAERASEAKTQFLATLSHEIRTPLNGVMGVADLLKLTEVTPKQREMLDIVTNSGAALTQIVDSVLDLAKIESGRFIPAAEPFDLKKLCQETAALFSGAAAAKHLELCCDIAKNLNDAYIGDAAALRQALSNLVGNAVKFTHQGEVRISARAAGERVLLSVADTGIGVEPDAQERIFESFEQADPSTTRRFGGTGLGLAIVRRLAEAMGGVISVESEPGVGSTFTLALPLVPVSGSVPSEPPELAEAPVDFPESPRRALIAEDNAVNRIVICGILRHAGWKVAVAENGREAVAIYAAAPPDLVLMDLSMPEMDGYEAARRIRALEERKRDARRPIIAVSAYVEAAHREQALAAGMDAFLAKPVSLDALRRVIDQHVAPREARPLKPPVLELAS